MDCLSDLKPEPDFVCNFVDTQFLPPELSLAIFELLPNIKGVLRLVHPIWRDFLDEVFNGFKGTQLNECLSGESLFDFATNKQNDQRFGQKTIIRALKQNTLSKEKPVIDKLISTTPFTFKVLMKLISYQRIDVLESMNLIETKEFPFQHPSQWYDYRWFRFMEEFMISPSDQIFEWGDLFMTKYYPKPKQPSDRYIHPVESILKNISPSDIEFPTVNALKRTTQRYSVPLSKVRLRLSSKQFTTREWIELQSFVQASKAQNILVSPPHMDKLVLYRSMSEMTLEHLKQIFEELSQYYKLYSNHKSISNPSYYVMFQSNAIYKNLFIPCCNHNLVDCVNHLIHYEYNRLLIQKKDMFDLTTLIVQVTNLSPVTEEYAAFWSQCRQLRELIPFRNHLCRFLAHDQIDLFLKYVVPCCHPWSIIDAMKKVISDPTIVQIAPTICMWIYQAVQSEEWISSVFRIFDLFHLKYEQVYKIWNESKFKDSSFAFACLLRTLKKNTQVAGTHGSLNPFVIYKWMCKGIFDIGDSIDSDTFEWIRSLPLFEKDSEITPSRFCFKSLAHLKKLIEFVPSLKDVYIWELVKFTIPKRSRQQRGIKHSSKTKKFHSNETIKEAIRYIKTHDHFSSKLSQSYFSQLWNKGRLPCDAKLYLFLIDEIKCPIDDHKILNTIFIALFKANRIDWFPQFFKFYLRSTGGYHHSGDNLWRKAFEYVSEHGSMFHLKQMIQVEMQISKHLLTPIVKTELPQLIPHTKKRKMQQDCKDHQDRQDLKHFVISYPIWYTRGLKEDKIVISLNQTQMNEMNDLKFEQMVKSQFDAIVAIDTEYNFLQEPYQFGCLFGRKFGQPYQKLEPVASNKNILNVEFKEFVIGIRLFVQFDANTKRELFFPPCNVWHLDVDLSQPGVVGSKALVAADLNDGSKLPKSFTELMESNNLSSFVQLCDANQLLRIEEYMSVFRLSEQVLEPCIQFVFNFFPDVPEFVMPLSATLSQLLKRIDQLFPKVKIKSFIRYREFHFSKNHRNSPQTVSVMMPKKTDPKLYSKSLKDLEFNPNFVYNIVRKS